MLFQRFGTDDLIARLTILLSWDILCTYEANRANNLKTMLMDILLISSGTVHVVSNI